MKPGALQAARGDAPPAPLELDAYLPYRLSVASNAVSDLIARAYRDRFGLSVPEWRMLCVLAEDARATQADIVQRTVMDKVTVSRASGRLARRGLLARSQHGADGRSHLLSLTDAGQALHAEIAPLALAYEAALISGLAPGEVATLKRLLVLLQAAAGQLAGS